MPHDQSLFVPERGRGQYRCVLANFGRKLGVVLGLLVSLASSGLKVGRSLAQLGGQHRHFQVSFLPISAPEMLAAKLKERERREREKERKREGLRGERERKKKKEREKREKE